MDAELFAKELEAYQNKLKDYVNNVFPHRAGDITLRFIEGNFRAQGWQGESFSPWKPNRRKGTILVLRGILRRGTYFTITQGEAHIINNVKYAAVHNRGFNGTVEVKGHKRRNFEAKRVETGKLTKKGNMRMKTIHVVKGLSEVRPHTRKMNIPKRPFFPESATDSPVLMNALRRELERSIKQIFQ